MNDYDIELGKLKLRSASLSEQYPMMTAALAAHRAKLRSVEDVIDDIFGSYRRNIWDSDAR